MAYTAWEKVKQLNKKKYGIAFPNQPEDYRKTKSISNIEKSSITFVRSYCENLGFSVERASCTDSDGNSIQPNLIPYNMEKDNDRLCLERAIHRFMETGTAADAFDIYYCYLEMFVGKYGKSKKMIEMLAEFEMNASSLLLKHRDHYSHSVYVFLLGLAIYVNCEQFRDTYKAEYGFAKEDEQTAAYHYLKYWGLSALFHDIGYPFELPFEQVKSYFEGSIKGVPFVSYKGVEDYIVLSSEAQAAWKKVLKKGKTHQTINEMLAESMADRLEETYGHSAEDIAENMLGRKSSSPDQFGGFMDHAYFSGIVLYRQLEKVIGLYQLTKDQLTAQSYLDALTAITLHNSLFKFGITNVKKEHTAFRMTFHPLAYMLMLCDELQCWDRTSYGQNSRQQLHPMGCDLEFPANNVIVAKYQYDQRFEVKKDQMKGTYKKMLSLDGKASEFLKDIEEILEVGGAAPIRLSIEAEFVQNRRNREVYLSDSNYIHLYNFTIVVHGRKEYDEAKVGDENFFADLEAKFDRLPLEYKMSGISRTKNYAKYLNRIGYFYTDRCVDYEMIRDTGFSEEEAAIIGEMEHERWNEEKYEMGWSYDTAYRDENHRQTPDGITDSEKMVRELTRTHYELGIPFEKLPDNIERAKDTEPLQKMIRLLEEYDGLRIYRIPGWKGNE